MPSIFKKEQQLVDELNAAMQAAQDIAIRNISCGSQPWSSTTIHSDKIVGDQFALNRNGRPYMTGFTDFQGNLTLMGQLMVRLHRGQIGVQQGGLMVACYKGIEIIDVRAYDDGVHVYVDTKKVAPFVITDGAEMFPSDTLIAKFIALTQ